MLNCAFLCKDKKIVGTRERQYLGLEGLTSFGGLIERNQRERVLATTEETTLLDAYLLGCGVFVSSPLKLP
jgi:hypothetical protein